MHDQTKKENRARPPASSMPKIKKQNKKNLHPSQGGRDIVFFNKNSFFSFDFVGLVVSFLGMVLLPFSHE